MRHDGAALLLPTPQGAIRGVLRSAAGATRAILLVDRGSAAYPWVPRLYDEFSLYVRAAGITTLRMATTNARTAHKPQTTQLAANEVLAGIGALRERGITRLAIVLASQASGDSRQEAHDRTLAEVIEPLVDVPLHGTVLTERLTDLIESVRGAVDSVAGTASLVLYDHVSSREPLRLVGCDRPPAVWPSAAAAGADGANEAAGADGAAPLAIRLGLHVDGRNAARVMSTLYRWIMEVLPVERTDEHILASRGDAIVLADTCGAAAAVRCGPLAQWHDHMRWLDGEWEHLLR
jgi:hypothetical protein